MKHWIIGAIYAAGLLLLLGACTQNQVEDTTETVDPVSVKPDTFDYPQLLPKGISLNLPDVSIDSSLELRLTDHYEFDCFLGYANQPASSEVIVLGLDTIGNNTFSQIASWADTIRSTITNSLRSNIWLNLWLDETTPYYALYYLEAHLRKAGFLKVLYRTADGKALPVRLPPFVENECNSMSNRPCRRKQIITEEKQKALAAMGLDPSWAPTVRYEDFVLKPENVYDLKVESNNQLLLGEQALSSDSLYQSAYNFLTGAGVATKKIFKVQVADEASFKHFLRAYSTVKLVYQDVWEQVAQSMFNKSYTSLERGEMIQVRSKWPIVIWLDKQKSGVY